MSLADDIENLGESQGPKAKVEVTSDGASVTDYVTEQEISDDWSEVFKLFKLNPDEFEVVDDTVRCSTWQQSKRTEDGHRDTVQLYSYSARFKRKAKQRLPDKDIERLRKNLDTWEPKLSRELLALGGPPTSRASVAAIINLADIQGGKSEGGGVAATQQRLLDGLANVQVWLDRMSQTYNVTELVLVNNGDPLEGCDGSYASQLFTVELNLRGQMNFVLDVWTKYAATLFPQFERAQFVSVLCNHGQLSRQSGRENRTSDSDNAGGFLAETLRRVLDSDGQRYGHVTWTIPHDEMNVFTVAAGVPLAFNHGHKIPSSGRDGFEKWLGGQVRGDDEAYRAKIWQTAHRHHFAAWDLGSCTVFQAPSLDGGSKWFRDRTGSYSRSGILTYLVGNHSPLGWSDLAFL